MSLKNLFILGNPRSGTSLLRLMLDSHSKIVVPPECGFLLWLEKDYGNWEANDLKTDRVQAYIKDLQASKKFETWNLSDVVLMETINLERPKNYEELSQCVYLAYAKKSDKKPLVLGDKNNYYIQHLEQLDNLYSKKYILHIIRDGRDVSTSYRGIDAISNNFKYKPKLSKDIDDIAEEWQQNNLRIHDQFGHLPNYMFIKFEDLLTNTKVTLNNIMHRLGLDFDEGMLTYYERNKLLQSEPKETLAWKKKTLEPLDTSVIGKYKKELTLEEIESFNITAKKALKLFDYAVEH